MAQESKVAVLIGSLRRESLSRKVALEVMRRAQERLACEIAEIGDLPAYNEDLDPGPPVAWVRFRDHLRAADGVLFVTPEYNRSVPGVLKNAVDVGSRPSGKGAINGKPAAIISQTPYRLGAFGANHALRQSFVFLDMPALQQPEVYLSGTQELINAEGRITAPDTVKLLDSFIAAFQDWIALMAGRKRPA